MGTGKESQVWDRDSVDPGVLRKLLTRWEAQSSFFDEDWPFEKLLKMGQI